MGINYGADKVRFPSPVPVGSKLRGRGELIDAKEVPGGVQATIRDHDRARRRPTSRPRSSTALTRYLV